MSSCNDNNFSLYHHGQLPLFPAFLRPMPSELFSSWIVRLAYAHYMKVHTFTTFNFPDRQFWNRDIDRSIKDDLLQELAARNNTSFYTVYQTTLRSYEGILFETLNEKTISKWIMPLGIYHRTWKNNGLMFCPGCLKKDNGTPYYRKEWRLSLFVACVRCESFLRDCCPHCGAAILFFRAELGHKFKYPGDTIGNCHRCNFSLSKSSLIRADDEILRIQNQIHTIMEFGFNKQVILPIQFFLVFKHLLKIFTGNRQIYLKAQVKLSEKLGLNYRTPISGCKFRYETLSIPERTIAQKMAFWVIEDWPIRFIDFFKSINIHSSDLLRDFDNVPYWYWSIVYENFFINNVNRRF